MYVLVLLLSFYPLLMENNELYLPKLSIIFILAPRLKQRSAIRTLNYIECVLFLLIIDKNLTKELECTLTKV